MSQQEPEYKHWINKYKMQSHIEGGYFTEIFRNPLQINPFQKQQQTTQITSENKEEKRNLSTSIFYLLNGKDFSCFHKIKSYEQWHYYVGNTSLIIHILNPKTKSYGKFILNNNFKTSSLINSLNSMNALMNPLIIDNNENNNLISDVTCIVEPECWFAAELIDKNEENFVLSGCTVSFGFDFRDFEKAKRSELLRDYLLKEEKEEKDVKYNEMLKEIILKLSREEDDI
ncbi:hypothetical protein ABK040_004251 [Willaertia magna]